LKKKEELTAELEYLLPTIPDVCPVMLSPNGIDTLIDKISSAAAT